MLSEEHPSAVLLTSSIAQNMNIVAIFCDGIKSTFSQCKLKMPDVLLCLLQICVLLFTCLYIVCYLILTHFKKTAEFVTGEFVTFWFGALFYTDGVT